MTVDEALELIYRAEHAEADPAVVALYCATTGEAPPMPRQYLGSLRNRLTLVIMASTMHDRTEQILRTMGDAFVAADMVSEAHAYIREVWERTLYFVDAQLRSGTVEEVRNDIWESFREDTHRSGRRDSTRRDVNGNLIARRKPWRWCPENADARPAEHAWKDVEPTDDLAVIHVAPTASRNVPKSVIGNVKRGASGFAVKGAGTT